MSNAIRYDSLLVRDLAAELDIALRGARLDAAHLERDALRVTLLTRAGRRADPPPPSLLWQLHPESGQLTTSPGPRAEGGRVQLRAPAPITRVSAPPDERMVVIELDAGDAPAGMARRIIIELMTNQWNAIAVGADERITAVLRERKTKERQLRAGVTYVPPARSTRPGALEPLPLDEWLATLADVPPGERLRAVLRFAYVSPLNAATIIGDADVTADPHALERAYERYNALVWTAPRAPALLRAQPYSLRIGDAVAMPSLLAAFDAAAALSATAAAPRDNTDAALARIAERLEALDRRAARLRGEEEGANAEAAQLRHQADVLMTQLHGVQRGARSVELDDFNGNTITIELDPTLDAARNAARLYDSARRRERAAARIPLLLRQVEGDRARLDAMAARIRDGAATPDEMAALLRARGGGSKSEAPALPYREYRTSSGIEVRVGRGARANDELTLRHSSSSDIWLHARDVAGAHVILRWTHAEQNPPAADITEAAVLAALHSRARTSGTVAVDWTRRKYVRKPRKSAPGAVIPERVKTVFVEPDAAVEERLRVQ